MRELLGKTVYFEPTGNNKRMHGEQILRAGVVEKVARVNMTVRFDGSVFTEKLRMDKENMCVYSDGLNAGYRIHLREQDYYDMLESIRIGNIINDHYRWGSHYRDIPVKDMCKVAEILGIDITK